ncbi:hypothetical protein C0992_006367 [Termitomyces sp. T32_za158]|nr:hypothetical protein C0992_006367 [Termitomyces sp. T32_za158]
MVLCSLAHPLPHPGVDVKASATGGYQTHAPGISFDRFIRACVVIKQLSEAFGRLDTDRDGWIQINYDQFMDTDLVTTARKTFHFENDAALMFGTSTLDVCRGIWTEFDESAYELLLECLDEVIVRPSVPHEDRDEDGDETSRSTTAPSAPSRHEPNVPAEPMATVQLSSSPPHLEFGVIPNPEPAAPQSTKSSLLIQLDVMSEQKSRPLSSSRQRTPEERIAELEIEEKPQPKFRPASATRQIKRETPPEPVVRAEPPTARQRLRHHQHEPREDVFEEEDEWDHVRPSTAATRNALDAGKKESTEDNEDENFWRFGTTSVGPSSGSSRKQEPLARPTISPISNPRSMKMGSTDYPEVKKEPEDKKKIRTARARLSSVNATQLPRASARPLANFHQNPEKRFMVTVYGPRNGQGADFRTRGGHKIRKVLESACKTFQLPFERSQLVLEVEHEDVTQYYCDPDETVGACGIDTDTRLLVQVDGLTEEELNQYGEEEDEE